MAKTSIKGTRENPYSMSECEKMLNAGTWPGGYVKDDAGQVSYVMKSVTVQGYSGSGSGSNWHGSDFEFCSGSYEWHEPDTDNKGCDEDGKGTPSGNEGGGTDTSGNAGGDAGGGGGCHPATPNANDGKNGTFLYNAAYYTEGEYNRMCKNGTWMGGNVYTLGYVGRDCIISPCLTSIDANDNWLSVFKEKSSAICTSLEKLGKEIMSLAYVQAIARYNSATGSPLYFDTKSLGIDDLRGCTCKKNKAGEITGINFLDVHNLQAQMKGKSLSERAVVLSTALTLGNVIFTRVSDGVYTIEKDKYDFDMHNWFKEPVRNVSTLIGFTVSEGASVVADAATLNVFAPVAGRYIDIATGMVRRHVLGQTSFYIYISGTVKVDEKK